MSFEAAAPLCPPGQGASRELPSAPGRGPKRPARSANPNPAPDAGSDTSRHPEGGRRSQENLGLGSWRFCRGPSLGRGQLGAQPVPAAELGGSPRSKEAARRDPDRRGARPQKGRGRRPRAAGDVPLGGRMQGWARSPRVGPRRERGGRGTRAGQPGRVREARVSWPGPPNLGRARPVGPKRQGRPWRPRLLPRQLCGDRRGRAEAAFPGRSGPVPRVQSPTRAGRAGFPGASRPQLSCRRLDVPNPVFRAPGKGSEEVFTFILNKAQHACGLGRNSVILINN